MKRRLNIFDAGVAFVMAFVIAQITAVIGTSISQVIMDICGMSETSIANFWDTAYGYLLQAIFMNIAFVLVFIWCYKKRDMKPVLTKPNKSTTKYMYICIALGIASLFLLSGVLNYFQLFVNKLGYDSSTLSYELNSPAKYLISLVSLALIPAICEELLFRGILTTALKEKGQIFAIVVSSIMFSIFHFSPSQLIYPICFGLILSIVYLRTKNIIFPILLHFINNALTISIQYFSEPTTTTFIHSNSMLIYTIITFGIWVTAIYYLFKDFVKHNLKPASNTNKLENQNLSLENASENENLNQTSIQNPKDIQEQKLNHAVLYGSIALMLLVYILLLFV
ncbi:MAG: type II CAAX prenyl endopeptidase Rce1 family protein [Clostridia bacterium]